jgi:polyisoprenyl-teichoic acid--peptidoglycan teichoic acid transferase
MSKISIQMSENEDIERSAPKVNRTKVHSRSAVVPTTSLLKMLTPKRIIVIAIIFIIGLTALYIINLVQSASKAFKVDALSLVANQLTGNTKALDSTDNKTTVLLVGVDNRSGDFSNDLKNIDNTDTLMLLSIDQNTKKVTMLSIPRDLGIKFNVNGQQNGLNKINSAVNYGVSHDYPGGGAQLLRDSIKQITGYTVNYTAIVNFQAFVDVINTVGGVEIDVENSFCDAGYPLQGDKGVETIKFIKGKQTMNGEIALKFARSRVHDRCDDFTAGDPVFEGSDFRRAYRQQQVITALKNKVSQMGFDIFKIQSIISSLGNNLLTQAGSGELNDNNKIDLETLKSFYSLKDQFADNDISKLVINPNEGCGKLNLYEDSIQGVYFILPEKANDYSNLQSCFNFYLQNSATINNDAKIAIYYVGNASASATKLNSDLKTKGFDSNNYGGIIIKNAFQTDGTTPLDLSTGTFICDYNNTKKDTVELIQKNFNATIIQKDQISKSVKSLDGADILIIVGK